MSSEPQPSSSTTTLIRVVLLILVLAVTGGTVVFLKQQTDIGGPLTPEGVAARDSIRRIAVPDTTPVPDLSAPATLTGLPDDSLATPDTRTPADAGYEDGYFAGISDAILGADHDSYDDSSRYPTALDRQAYADAYRRGYDQGQADGHSSTNPSPEPDDEDLEDE